MGLEEGRHFTVKMPEGDRDSYVLIRREGLAYAAWLSVYGSGMQRELAAEFVKHILERAKEEGNNAYEKVKEIIKEGVSRGSLRLEDFEREVEVNGRKHVVKVIGGGAEFDEGRSGKKLLRLTITAEVDGVGHEYEVIYGRYGRNNTAVARANALGGREADAERLSALIEALTGRELGVYRKKNGKIRCYREHLDGVMHFAELADAIPRWLKETSW